MSSFIWMCNISQFELSALPELPVRLIKSMQLKLLPEEYSDWFNLNFYIILFIFELFIFILINLPLLFTVYLPLFEHGL